MCVKSIQMLQLLAQSGAAVDTPTNVVFAVLMITNQHFDWLRYTKITEHCRKVELNVEVSFLFSSPSLHPILFCCFCFCHSGNTLSSRIVFTPSSFVAVNKLRRQNIVLYRERARKTDRAVDGNGGESMRKSLKKHNH